MSITTEAVCTAAKYTEVEKRWPSTATAGQRLEFQSARHGVTVDSWRTEEGYFYEFACGHVWFSPVLAVIESGEEAGR